MNFYKEFFLTTLEIAFAIFIIIFGYAIWDNFDQTDYNTAKYYDNTKNFEVLMEDSDNLVTLKNNEDNIEYKKLYLHNISDKDNKTLLTLKIENNNIILKNNLIIKINENYYDLSELDFKSDEYYDYFVISDINFEGYETKEYNVKILLKNEIDNNINEYLNYEFTTFA